MSARGERGLRVVAALVTFGLAGFALFMMALLVGLGTCNEDEYPPPPPEECDGSLAWLMPLVVGGPFVLAGCALMLDRRHGAWTAPVGFVLALAGVGLAATLYLF